MERESFFCYNEKSILTNKFVIGINYTLLIFSLIVFEPEGIHLRQSDYYMLLLFLFFASILNSFINSKITDNTDFYEWDYTERKKKGRFINSLIFVTGIFSNLFFIDLFLIYLNFESYNNQYLLFFFCRIIPLFLFLLNAMKPIELHHFIFEDDIKIRYKIQKKPENWQDSGKEIKENDEIKEIIRRDFNIDL
ncbi:MAG: hypothetical protein ACOYOT_02715 [Bacteroidales bacterium]